MPPKIRELIVQLERAGFRNRGGKGSHKVPSATRSRSFTVPREFLELASTIGLHRDPKRFALLYRMLLRVPDEDRDDAYARFVADLKLSRPYAS